MKYTRLAVAALLLAFGVNYAVLAQSSACGDTYAAGAKIPQGCPQPAGTMPDPRPRDKDNNLIIPTQAAGMDIGQFEEMTCPRPCPLTKAQIQENFATFAAYQNGGTGDPLANIAGAATSDLDGGGSSGGSSGSGSGSSSCASTAGNGFSPMATMFGPNITKGIADQLVRNGILPPEVAAILSMPDAPADRMAWAMQQLEARNLPTNPLDLAKNALPLVGTVVNGVATGGVLDVAISQGASRFLTPQQMAALNFARDQALSNGNTLTEAARGVLQMANLPTTTGELAKKFDIDLNVPKEFDALATVDNLLPSELKDIEEALTIVASFEGIADGDITFEDMQAAIAATGKIGPALGIGDMSMDDVAEMFTGLEQFENAAQKASDGDGNPKTAGPGTTPGTGVKPSDLDALFSAIASDPTFSSMGGSGGLTASSLAGIFGELSTINDITSGNPSQMFNNMNAIAAAFTPLSARPSGTGSAGSSQPPSPDQIITAFRQLSNVSGGNSTQSVAAILNTASMASNFGAVQSALGLNPQQTTQVLNSLKSLNGIQDMNVDSIAGAFGAAQRVMSSGILRGVDMTKVTDVFKSLSDKINLPEFADKFKYLNNVKEAMATFSQIKGLGGMALNDLKGFSSKLQNIDIIKKLGLDKYGKIVKAPAALKRFNDFTAEKMKKALDKIKNFGPAQLQKLFEKMPNLPIDKLNRLLTKGMAALEDAIRKIPGANAILDRIPGGLQGAINILGSLNFSSAGCLFQSALNKAACPDGPTPTPCKGNGASNAASGGGQDDTYKNYCFKGPLQPRPYIQVDEENEETGLTQVDAIEPDFDMGADGSKAKGCILHKDTETRTLLSMNDSWLLLEQELDGPRLQGSVVVGQSPYYKSSENEHKLKGALVEPLGGVSSTTFPPDTLSRLKCDYFPYPDCGGRFDLTKEEKAQLNRINYDACTNKYIFNLMRGYGKQVGGGGNAGTDGLNFIYDPQVVRGDVNYDQTWCQPLKMIPVQCEPDLLNLRRAIGGIASDIATDITKDVTQTAFNQATGGRSGPFGSTRIVGEMIADQAGSMAGSTVGNFIGGGPASGACVQKKCERDGGCTRQTADKYDYEAWRYLARGWLDVLDLKYLPMRNQPLPDVPADGEKKAKLLAKIRDEQNTGDGRGRFGGFMDDTWKTFGDGMAADSWGNTDIQINGLIKKPYERIWDPTHPYSPRYDSWGNDRNVYSPMAASYFEVSPCEVRCAAVKVDLMSFRHPQFKKCMGCRIGVNTACMWAEIFAQTICPGPCIPLPTAIANSRKGASPVPLCATPLKIQKKWPPCNTKFDVNGGKDNVPAMCYGCVLASGDADPFGGVKKCCSDLAKPIAPINTLKIRSRSDMTRTPPEGYQFADYFGDHKPYMRWWDTGGEAGTPGGHDQMSSCGSKDVIVGVGTEKRGCNYGGGGGQSVDCLTVKKNDPLTSWMELKLYQTNTFRTYRLNCLGQYEKLFKSNSAEDFALTLIGKNYSASDESGQSSPRGFRESWRGYVTDSSEDSRFPKQYSTSSYRKAISKPYGDLPQGLDNAQEGDVLIWDKKVTPGRMPHVAVVEKIMTQSNTPTLTEKERVVVIREMNAGKYPDACGTTDAWGVGTRRYLHKNCITFEGRKAEKGGKALDSEESIYEQFIATGTVQDSAAGTCYVAQKDDFVKGFYTFGCEDPNMRSCEEKDWKKVVIYRPCAAGSKADCRD